VAAGAQMLFRGCRARLVDVVDYWSEWTRTLAARLELFSATHKREEKAPALEATVAEDHEAASPPSFTYAEIRTVVIGVGLAMFLAALDQTIVATALPTIGRDFNDFENLSWIVTAYLLTSTAAAPIFGKLCDIRGRRTMLLWGIGLFVAGSLACALAPNMLLLVLARGLQGAGGGGIMPVAQTVISDVVTPRERGRYQAYLGIVWICSGISGPVLGGFLAEHLHWSAIFWINLPLGLLAATMVFTTLRRLPRNERKRDLDILGGTLIMIAAVLFLLAVTWGGTRYAWGSSTIIGLLLVSALAAVASAWRVRQARDPFLPIPILANAVVRAGTAASASVYATIIGLTIFVPIYYESVHKLSASDSGLALIPIVVMTTPGSILSGRILMHMHRYKWISVVGCSASLAAILVLVLWPTMPLALAIVVLGIVGFGIGTVYPVAMVSIQSAVERHQVGTVTGLMNFCRALTSSFVVALMGAIMLAAMGVAPGKGANIEELLSGTADTNFTNMFRWVFACAALFLSCALVALSLMKELSFGGRRKG
jgi:EmrB/QacA subfamily drug resistance transporter